MRQGNGENREKETERERRLPWRLIVSENPLSRSFCFRFYFLPSNPPVHCLPFVHTVPRASQIPASRDSIWLPFKRFSLAYLTLLFVAPFSRCSTFSLLTLPSTHKPASSVSLVSLQQRVDFNNTG